MIFFSIGKLLSVPQFETLFLSFVVVVVVVVVFLHSGSFFLLRNTAHSA